MRRACYFLLLLMVSCQYFETEKVDADTLFEQEMATINWDEVDQYPLFPNCDETQDKATQLRCFHGELSGSISQVLHDSVPGMVQSLHDTVWMDMRIDTSGVFSIKNVKMDSITEVQLPRLESWLKSALVNMQPVSPATKKGVPVATEYTLPLVLATN